MTEVQTEEQGNGHLDDHEVRAALTAAGGDGHALLGWSARPLPYRSFLPGRRLIRVVAATATGAPWSAIVKESDPGDEGGDRERRLYLGRRLGRLPDGIRAPRAWQARENRLWLEDVDDRFGGQWPAWSYPHAATRLGRFGAAFAGDGGACPWLNHDWARRHNDPGAAAELTADALGLLERVQHAGALSHWSARRLALLLSNQPATVAALACLPVTFCHHDASRANLIADGEVTVAVDWEEAGPGPIGADLAGFVIGTLRRGLLEESALGGFEDRVVDAYLRGTGALGPSAATGYRLATLLRWDLPVKLLHLLSADEPAALEVARHWGVPLPRLVAGWTLASEILLRHAGELE